MKNVWRIGAWFVVTLLVLFVAAVVAAYFSVRASLPRLDGDINATGFKASVTATRDHQGTVTITAKDALDAMRALGFIHAQERFFEMDLARRAAAGELSALLGEATIKIDKDKRRDKK